MLPQKKMQTIEEKEMIVNKKCKGNGVTKGYGCGLLVPVSLYNKSNRIYGLGVSCGCYSNWLLNSEQGKIKLQKSILKASKPRKEFETAKTVVKGQNTVKRLLVNLMMQLHAYVRERDKGKPCISCYSQWNDSFQAGHFYKAELYSNLKFEETNTHGQCPGCNIFNDGNESGYRVGLINRYGKDFVDALDLKATSYKKDNFKWEIDYLKEKLKHVQKLKKELNQKL